MRMITACFARALKGWTSRICVAFSPHVSRGYADQQNSQPVTCLFKARDLI
jgi:hypothetical protein